RDSTNTANLFGHHDLHLQIIEKDLGVRVSARGDELLLDGPSDAVRQAEKVLTELASLTLEGYDLRPEDITFALKAARSQEPVPLRELFLSTVPIATRKRFVVPKSAAQKAYIEAIQKFDI